MPLDVNAGGQMEQVFERIEREWGQLDILLHSIAFSPRETLHGRVIDVERDGFLQAFRNSMSCWTSAKKGAGRSLVSIDDFGAATAFLALDGAKLITGGVTYVDGGYHITD